MKDNNDNNFVLNMSVEQLNTPREKLSEREERSRKYEEIFATNLIVEFLKTREDLSMIQMEKVLDQAKDILKDTAIGSLCEKAKNNSLKSGWRFG